MGACVPPTEAGTGEAIGLGAEKAEAHLLPRVCLARGPVQGITEPWAEWISQHTARLGCPTAIGDRGEGQDRPVVL